MRKASYELDTSFRVKVDRRPFFDGQWYYHPEVEVIVIRKSCGMLCVGDRIDRYNEGDVLVLGGSLPHLFKSDPEYFQGREDLGVETIVVHFKEDFWGKDLLTLPEFRGVREMLELGSRGLRLQGEARGFVTRAMERLLEARGAARVTGLLEILDVIATRGEYDVLSSVGFLLPESVASPERLNRIYNYTFHHFSGEITVEEVASAAHISRNYFCRYFKKWSGKTYWRFLLEVRIGYACRLLVEDKLTVSEICYRCGFNNLSNFNRQFKSLMQTTPVAFQKHYLESAALERFAS
jgi:AraC-like DNA-binding protein